MELIVGKRYEWTDYVGGGCKINGVFLGMYEHLARFMMKNGEIWLIYPECCEEYILENP